MDSRPCTRCARALGRSCCQVEEGEALATLTWADVDRLEAGGQRRGQFLEDEWLTWEVASEYERRRPLYAGYFRDGPRRLTLQRRAGACVFFQAGAGCRLSAALRPSGCLLYPFDLSDSGQLSLQVDRYPTLEQAESGACLAVQEADSYPALARLFDTDEVALHALAQRIRDEVRAHSMVSPP